MLPRRCLPSWFGWQLHVNGGGDLISAGVAVVLLTPSARAFPGGPARLLPWHTVVPGKDIAGDLAGFLGKDLVEDRCLPILI